MSKTVEKDYQYGFSDGDAAMFDVVGRRRKAASMVAVLQEHFGPDLKKLKLLNVGGSAGIIDSFLAQHVGAVTGIDIDEKAIAHAQAQFQADNLDFIVGDAMNMEFAAGSFDIVVCSQVYEHVPDAGRMIEEIHRVLKQKGVCYLAASNRLMWNEPHYNLPLLSVIPKWLADYYIRAAGKGDEYYETHYTYWGLKKLTREFRRVDFTRPMIASPAKYKTEYMLPPGSFKAKVAGLIAKYAYWMVPGYIWLLEK